MCYKIVFIKNQDLKKYLCLFQRQARFINKLFNSLVMTSSGWPNVSINRISTSQVRKRQGNNALNSN